MPQPNFLPNYSPLGNVYIADTANNRIRKVTVSTGIITTVAGTGVYSYSGDNGQATSAALRYPYAVTFDASGITYTAIILASTLLLITFVGNVCIADTQNNRIRKVAVSTGIITTFAGTGTTTYSGDGGAATSATLSGPEGVLLDAAGNPIHSYMSQFNSLSHYSPLGNVYIGDSGNNRVRKVTTVSTSSPRYSLILLSTISTRLRLYSLVITQLRTHNHPNNKSQYKSQCKSQVSPPNILYLSLPHSPLTLLPT